MLKNSNQVTCLRCKTTNEFHIENSGPHIKAICDNCGIYIKFLPKDFINGTGNRYPVNKMAADKIIHLRVDVTKLNKEWFYKGEKGTYADMVLFFNNEQDQYESNGMITQSVPARIYEKEKDKPVKERTQGAILGNAKVWEKKAADGGESVPGSESKKKKAVEKKEEEEDDNDLPF